MKYSLIMTVYNRPLQVLANTLTWLYSNDLSDTQVIVVDDGSDIDYTPLKNQVNADWFKIDSVSDCPDVYHIDGHNNPAYANNQALNYAKGENVIWLSSDCIIQPRTMQKLREFDLNEFCYSTSVLDIASGNMFLGPQRIFPACWFFASSMKSIEAVDGFDENYMKGMAFEDNDFTARIFGEVGKLAIDCRSITYHQSHSEVAYSDDLYGYKKSEEYTLEKWNGEKPWWGKVPSVKVSMGGDGVVYVTPDE